MSSLTQVLFVFTFIFLVNSQEPVPLPVILWHGMGDSCCFPFSLGAFKRQLEEELPGVHVESLKIGGNVVRDYESGYFIHPDDQIKEVCDYLKKDPKYKDGYNAIGFSQGGIFVRALKQRCTTPRMINAISLGGPQQGVFGLPNCPALTVKTCEGFRDLLNFGAYLGWIQRFLVQATYWHDPLHEETYRNYSTFLADINNEREINQDYINNLQNLKRLILVKFENDTIVQPKQSQWFGYYRPGQDKEIIPLEETVLYKEDRIGLKAMEKTGQLVLLETEGNHLQFKKKWFQANILPYLKEQA